MMRTALLSIISVLIQPTPIQSKMKCDHVIVVPWSQVKDLTRKQRNAAIKYARKNRICWTIDRSQ